MISCDVSVAPHGLVCYHCHCSVTNFVVGVQERITTTRKICFHLAGFMETTVRV
jgi:hypothetical protein